MPTYPSTATLTNASVNVLNAIRNEASINYQQYIPYATPDADSIRSIGATLMDYPALMNEFLPALIGRIGRVAVTSRLYNNPLAALKKGILDYGETIEDIFIAMAEPYEYDPDDAEETLYKRYAPDVKSTFYTINYRKFYPVTIQEQDLRRAFLSADSLTDFYTKVIEQLYTGAYADEFLATKYMIAKNILDGKMHAEEITADSKEIAKKIRAVSNKFTFMSTEYNIAGVNTYSDRSKQYILVNADFDAALDVDVLAYAFNMDRADVTARKIVIDSFGALDNTRLAKLFKNDPNYTEISAANLAKLDKVAAVLIDEDFTQIYDNLLTIRDEKNGKGLYTNYFLHNWKTFAVSPFANNAVLVQGTPAVTGVTVSPSAVSAKVGDEVRLSAKVTTDNFASQKVIWTSSNAKVTVNAAGVVTIGTGASGSVTITATSVANPAKKGTATITVS